MFAHTFLAGASVFRVTTSFNWKALIQQSLLHEMQLRKEEVN